MTLDLFAPPTETLAEGALLLRGFALDAAPDLLAAITAVAAAAPFRHLVTPGGFRMSVAMTNCGGYGWVSDRRGYRYDPVDPENGRPWPPLPPLFLDLARRAAAAAGFSDFRSDVCLINRYLPGTRLTLHQDKDEGDFTQPIVSVSLGLPATFLWGGLARADKAQRIPLAHGDIVVWGGPSRLRYHGIAPLKPGSHPLLGEQRLNLTFRRAR
ncbi:MAG: DNA oxidative demethylase AlkB [Rhodospirillaceae bacterium]|nr:DNA oxidative demethylase AlkB [Rhodospirillaceae bacterium]